MYVVAIAATVIVFSMQTLWPKFSHGILGVKVPGRLIVTMNDQQKTLDTLEEVLCNSEIDIQTSHIKRNKEHMVTYTFGLMMPEHINVQEVVEDLSHIKSVTSIDF